MELQRAYREQLAGGNTDQFQKIVQLRVDTVLGIQGNAAINSATKAKLVDAVLSLSTSNVAKLKSALALISRVPNKANQQALLAQLAAAAGSPSHEADMAKVLVKMQIKGQNVLAVNTLPGFTATQRQALADALLANPDAGARFAAAAKSFGRSDADTRGQLFKHLLEAAKAKDADAAADNFNARVAAIDVLLKAPFGFERNALKTQLLSADSQLIPGLSTAVLAAATSQRSLCLYWIVSMPPSSAQDALRRKRFPVCRIMIGQAISENSSM